MVVLRGRYNPFNLAAFNARLDHGLLLGLTGQGAGGGANDHGLGSDDSPTFVGATLSGLTAGRVLFAGTGGVVDDDAACLWDDVNKTFTIQNGSAMAILVGADNGANTLTDATRKFTRIAMPHYTNAEEPVSLIFGDAQETKNIVSIGGGSSLMNAAEEIRFYTAATHITTTGNVRARIIGNGYFGINEATPETLTEWTHAQPYLTLHNSTHEDTDGGRESRLNFKGEQSGGEETTLARIEIGHDGTGDDQLGKEVHSINTGAGLATAMTLDSSLDAFFTKIKLTALGGYAVKLTNKTGANSVAGQLVKADTANDDAVVLAAAGDVECFGVFLDAGIADGSEAWVVVGGIADVAFDDNVGTTRGDWVSTGVLAGYAATAASPAAAPTHFEEIGHCIETVAAGGVGTHILARCVLHFN